MEKCINRSLTTRLVVVFRSILTGQLQTVWFIQFSTYLYHFGRSTKIYFYSLSLSLSLSLYIYIYKIYFVISISKECSISVVDPIYLSIMIALLQSQRSLVTVSFTLRFGLMITLEGHSLSLIAVEFLLSLSSLIYKLPFYTYSYNFIFYWYYNFMFGCIDYIL